MITFLQGKLIEKQPTRVVMDVGGIGYEVLIPLSSFDRLPSVKETCRIFTYYHVREDAHQLFGFMTEDERRMFVLLMSVTGIGPKLALSTLSGLSVRDLKAAIVEGDVKRLSSISGVGRKLAERMVVDLRDKIGKAEALEAVAGAPETAETDTRMRDAILALIALGYKQEPARKMVMAVLRHGGKTEMTVEDIVRKSLNVE